MPRGDKSGPMGQGPMTGRSMGREKRRKFYGRQDGTYEHTLGKLVRIYDSLFFAEKKWYSACRPSTDNTRFLAAPE